MNVPRFALFLLAGLTVHAASIVYDNGAPAFENFYAFSPIAAPPFGFDVQADSFILTSAQTITDGVIWVYEVKDSIFHPQRVPTSINWTIYSNSSGMPGSVIASGSSPDTILASNLTLAIPLNGEGFEVDFSFGNLSLGAGTYWLGLSEPGNEEGSGLINTASQGNGCCEIVHAPFETWRDRISPFTSAPADNHLAFQLLNGSSAAVANPEPASMGLVGIALIALGYSARRIRSR